MCRLPEDVEQLERLNSAMSNLATDNDRDVAGEARAVNDLFKRTPVGVLPHGTSTDRCRTVSWLLQSCPCHVITADPKHCKGIALLHCTPTQVSVVKHM